jgi:formate hydrogenlyase subunit 3/multisubunit Na+/H+ antiporter MnhD subunit
MRLSLLCALLGGVSGIAFGIHYFLHPMTGRGRTLYGGYSVKWLPSLGVEIYVDQLAALFVIMIAFFAIAISVYSFSFLKGEPEGSRIAAFYNLYLWSLICVVIANNIFLFLLFWELMTLSSAYLVLYRYNQLSRIDEDRSSTTADYRESLISPRLYLIASHISTVLIMVALLGLAFYAQNSLSEGDQRIQQSFSFDVLRDFAKESPGPFNWIFIPALIGFGIKAGIVPFHIWLPDAHPTSPANIHAMMSGVMIKIAVYAMLRMFFEFMGRLEWWWGALLLILASVTAVVGVFYAIFNSNLKTALAYHSVENIGIILIGVGLAVMFQASPSSSQHTQLLASLALTAALYHVINHAIFKGMLFLCVGAIEKLTTTVKIEELGGLAQRFPCTSSVFVIGALAISGLPPLNGFASEWLTVQALLAGPLGTEKTITSFAQFVAQVLSLILLSTAIALTAFCFCKIVVTAFLGQKRSPDERKWDAQDVAPSMRGVLLLLAAFCFLLGLFPMVVVEQLEPISARLIGDGLAPAARIATVQIPSPSYFVAGFQMQILLLSLLALSLGLITYFFTRISSGLRSRIPSSPIWNCGNRFRPQQMQLTEATFVYWIAQTFGKFTRRARAPAEYPSGKYPYLQDEMVPSTDLTIVEVFRRGLNRALEVALRWSELCGRKLQNGDVRWYLLYIFAIILGVLLILAPR